MFQRVYKHPTEWQGLMEQCDLYLGYWVSFSQLAAFMSTLNVSFFQVVPLFRGPLLLFHAQQALPCLYGVFGVITLCSSGQWVQKFSTNVSSQEQKSVIDQSREVIRAMGALLYLCRELYWPLGTNLMSKPKSSINYTSAFRPHSLLVCFFNDFISMGGMLPYAPVLNSNQHKRTTFWQGKQRHRGDGNHKHKHKCKSHCSRSSRRRPRPYKSCKCNNTSMPQPFHLDCCYFCHKN